MQLTVVRAMIVCRNQARRLFHSVFPRIPNRIVGLAVVQLISFLLLQPTVAALQQPTRIEGDACTACSLTIERIGTLSGAAVLSQPNEVRRLQSGEFAVVFGMDRSTISVFNTQGRLVRTIGRSGGGPGEYEFIVQVIPESTDRLAVWDPMQSRLTYVSNGDVDRILRIPYIFGRLLPFGDGYVASGLASPPPALAGYPLHFVSSDGEVTASFGTDDGVFRADRPIDDARALAVANDSVVWSAAPTRYLLEAWDRNGERVAAIERVVGWFPPGTHVGAPQDDRKARPASYLRKIELDDSGLLWTLTLAADDRWLEAVETRTSIQGTRVTGPASAKRDLYWDTVIEIIDPATEKLVASHRFDEYMPSFAGAGYIYRYQESEGGLPSIELYRIDHPTIQHGR